MNMDIDLLYRKLEGNLTEKESRQVDDWLNASERHARYFEQLSLHFRGEHPYSLTDSAFDTYRKQFIEKLEAMQQNRRSRLLHSPWLRYAAAVLLLVAAGYFVHLLTKPDATPPVVEDTVAPAPAEEPTAVTTEKLPKVSNRKVVLNAANGISYNIRQLNVSTALSNAQFDISKQMISYDRIKPADNRIPETKLNELVVERGADFRITLSDGTRVWLNSESTLQYPTYFTGKERKIQLTGEAYFEVAKDAKHPFIVSANGVDVRVCGTRFNINTRRHGAIAATLVEGAIVVIPADRKEEILLVPGNTAEYIPETGVMEIKNDDIQLYIGWMKGEYHFKEITLEDLLNEVARWHDVNIVFEDEKLKTEKFTGIFARKAPLHNILSLIEKTNYIECSIHGKNVEIRENQIQTIH